jgi:hypothetical protein
MARLRAVRSRKAMVRIASRIRADSTRPNWFFGVWQADSITDPRTGDTMSFEDADLELLCTEPRCWTLEPGARRQPLRWESGQGAALEVRAVRGLAVHAQVIFVLDAVSAARPVGRRRKAR